DDLDLARVELLFGVRRRRDLELAGDAPLRDVEHRFGEGAGDVPAFDQERAARTAGDGNLLEVQSAGEPDHVRVDPRLGFRRLARDVGDVRNAARVALGRKPV